MVKTTPEKAPRKPPGRSKVTNGKLGDMDGRGKWARRLADLIEGYSQEVTDDPASLPMSTRVIIRRIATLTLVLEREDEAFAKADKAEPKAFDAYQTVTNSLRRLLADLQISVGSPDRLQRAASEHVIENGRLIRRVEDVVTESNDRNLARQIAFALALAEKSATLVDPDIAAFAHILGFVEQDPEGTVIDFTSYRH